MISVHVFTRIKCKPVVDTVSSGAEPVLVGRLRALEMTPALR